MGAGQCGGKGAPAGCTWLGACGGALPKCDGSVHSDFGLGDPSIGSDVIVHVYDVADNDLLSAANELFLQLGFGIFHVGVEVYGWEWSYGAAESGSGLYFCLPGCCRSARYREAINVGHTDMPGEQVMLLLRDLEEEWEGSHYHVLERNCTHFVDTFCRQLLGGKLELPSFITGLPRMGTSIARRFKKAGAVASPTAPVQVSTADGRTRVRL